MDTAAIDALNQLLILLNNSLPKYLQSAKPFMKRGDEPAAIALEHLVQDQSRLVELIADSLRSQDALVYRGEFPMEFTDLHDLSMDYLLRLVIERQRESIGQIDRLSTRLNHWPQAKALAQEALGSAKGHLLSLQEAVATPAA